MYAAIDILVSVALGYYLYKSRTRVHRWVAFYLGSLRSAIAILTHPLPTLPQVKGHDRRVDHHDNHNGGILRVGLIAQSC